TFDAGLLEGGRCDEAPERSVDPLDIGLAGERAAGHADDAALRRQLPVAMAVVEARQGLAHGEGAGSAEDDHVERFDGDELRAHGLIPSPAVVPAARRGPKSSNSAY